MPVDIHREAHLDLPAPPVPEGRLRRIGTDGDVSYRTSWSAETEPWGLGDFWDDFSLDGRLKTGEETSDKRHPGSLAVELDIPPGESRSVMFFITWHFPNRYAWPPSPQASRVVDSSRFVNRHG